jgi:hypothetical protein
MPFPAGSEPRRSTRLGPSQPVRPHPPASGSARSSLLRNCAYQPVAGRDRHHLPAQLTSFVGREQELAMLGKLLGVARLVTLTGPAAPGRRGWRWIPLTGCGWLIWPGFPTQPGGAQMMEALGVRQAGDVPVIEARRFRLRSAELLLAWRHATLPSCV